MASDVEMTDEAPQGAVQADENEATKVDDAMDEDQKAEQEEVSKEQDAQQIQEESKVTDEQWEAMSSILSALYDHRMPDGHDPSRVFHKKVNKRIVPDYYDVIKEPIAMSTIKARLNLKQYKDFAEFVRDFALIPHNAQVYNRPGAGAYFDALEIKKVLETELLKLVEANTITADEAKLPFLGEIPEEEDPPAGGDGDEEDDDDDDEADDSDDSQTGKRRRGRPGRKSMKREDSAEGGQPAELDPRKRRGRPPRVDTPTEARIKNILKFMRRPRNEHGQQLIDNFERLPDKATIPEYYQEIRNPMAVDVLKKKLKRKKYNTVEQFLVDVDLIFNNAKAYNTEDSVIYKDAVELQQETMQYAKVEIEKPDSEYASEDGRIPLPGGVQHNGETFKVGDWVHIQNPNDLSKPIPTQIYRTWKDVQGSQFINACWYYRPEQTVHRFDKHFFEHEVVKTGQYRDHSVDEIVDRCFVMFVTRFNKGRPRGLPADKEVYVCESRYNEEKLTFNKIKTWASCLPDEVRDKDYEMDMFNTPKRMKKKPSPIAYLIKEDQKETDDVPQPVWGSDGAPPKIGAVHRRPRDLRDSPPPERTPTPPPKPPTPPPRQPSQTVMQAQPNGRMPNGYSVASATPAAASPATFAPPHRGSVSTPAHRPPPRGYQTPITPAYHPPHILPQQPAHIQPAPSYVAPAQQHHHAAPPPPPPPQTSTRYTTAQQQQGYAAPQPIEAWHLPDGANALLAVDLASQFRRDEQGRVLFFTAPPMDVPLVDGLSGIGHSAKFLGQRGKRVAERKRARAVRDEAEAEERRDVLARRMQEEDELLEKSREEVVNGVREWCAQIGVETVKELREMYGERWRGVIAGEP